MSARLDAPLSRWLWLVKWLLVLPHLIAAPDKRWFDVPQAGHRPQFEQPEAFADVLRTVLSETG